VSVLAGGILLAGLSAVPARAKVEPPVDPAAVTALVTAWDNATGDDWAHDGGTYDERSTDARFTEPNTQRRVLLDPATKSFREKVTEHGLLPTIEVVRGKHRADRTVKEIRKALRRHHVRPVPAWTGDTLSASEAARQLDRATNQRRTLPNPSDFRWNALTAVTAGDGTTTFTGAYERWTDGGTAPYYTATLHAVADAQHRLTSWRQVGEFAGAVGVPATPFNSTLTWTWQRPTIKLPHANTSLRKVVRTENQLRTQVSILADTVNQYVAENGPVTVKWLQRRFENRYTVRIPDGLRFVRVVQGFRLAWKVVLRHGAASYHVVST
jgi:hypothetical protein